MAMTKKEFQELHGFSNECMEFIDIARRVFNGKITQIREGNFYDKEILSRNKEKNEGKKDVFSSFNKNGNGEKLHVFYNK